MSIFESVVENAERGRQEANGLEDVGRRSGYERVMEKSETGEKASDYQDRMERFKQRSENREQALKERTQAVSGQNEISFGSRAAENAADKLEERKKLERQAKQQAENLRIHEKGLDKAVRDDSSYWTNHYTQEIKTDARNLKNIEKKLSKL